MSTAATFGPQTLGQAEKALNAILRRQLAGTGLTEPQWVTLSLTLAGGQTADRDALAGRVAGVLKVTAAEAQARIAELAEAQMLEASGEDGAPVTVTAAGQQLHGEVRGSVAQITQRLWGDLPAEDLATAARVLDTVLERANAELAGA